MTSRDQLIRELTWHVLNLSHSIMDGIPENKWDFNGADAALRAKAEDALALIEMNKDLCNAEL